MAAGCSCAGQAQPLLAAGGGYHAESFLAEEALHQVAHRGVVVDDEHGARPVRQRLQPVGLRAAALAAALGIADRRAGRRMVKVEPLPGSLSTVMSPPIIWQKRWLIASPSPVPPYLRVVEASACVNAWNSFAICSGVMPMPVSLTRNVIHSAPSTASRLTVSAMVPLLGELAGVAEQVEQLCRTLVRSARMAPRSSAQWTTSVLAFFSTSGWTVVATSWIMLRDVERLQEEVHLAGLDLRQVEDVVDERQQVLARGVDLLEVGGEVLLAQVFGLFLQHLAVADDGVQRRAQLVAHVGQELALGAVGGFRLFRLLQSFE